jgi:hypothetical protein
MKRHLRLRFSNPKLSQLKDIAIGEMLSSREESTSNLTGIVSL